MGLGKSGDASFVLHRGCNKLEIHAREEGSCFSQVSGKILKLKDGKFIFPLVPPCDPSAQKISATAIYCLTFFLPGFVMIVPVNSQGKLL